MTTESKNSLNVFLCHASEDRAFIRDIYSTLLAYQIDVWFDEEKLLPGHDWQYEIIQAVRKSDVIIICLSNKSINKIGYVQKEIKYALNLADERPGGEIFIIPARLDECEVPDRLKQWQWVNLFESNGISQLAKSLSLVANIKGIRLISDISFPAKQDKFTIRGFGNPIVNLNNKVIGLQDWKTQSVKEFFYYLLENPNGVSKEEIQDVFFPFTSFENMRIRFKNMIYRIRRATSSESLVYENEKYFINRNLINQYDVEDFITKIQKIERTEDRDTQISLIIEADELVKGTYLKNINSSWTWNKRELLTNYHKTALLKLLSFYKEDKKYDSMIKTCRRLLIIDPFFEEAYRQLMQVYFITGNNSEIVKTYDSCKSKLLSDLGVNPSKTTTNLFNKLLA